MVIRSVGVDGRLLLVLGRWTGMEGDRDEECIMTNNDYLVTSTVDY